MPTELTMNIYDEIKAERERQDQVWGGHERDDRHNAIDWIGYIAKHSAKAAGGSVEILDEGHWWTCRMTVDGNGTSPFRRQMIRVAALAVAAIESFDRRAAETERIAERLRANRGGA